MRAFRFRLARLLHLREAEKRQRASELAVKRQEFDHQQQILREELREREATTGSYRDLKRHPASAASWASARDAVRLAEVRVARQATVTRETLAEVDRARDRLIEKSREVESYHRLRERQRAEHDTEARREEQKGLDEMAVQRFHEQRRDEAAQE